MGQLARLGNAFAAAGIAIVLLVAFGLQFGLKELPCPLCNLQRVAFALCGFGFLLNLRFGVQPLHYGLSLLAALFGVAVAGRQVLLHIVPGSGSYGSAIFGFYLYTWSLLAFSAVIAGIALLMILGGRPDHVQRPSGGAALPRLLPLRRLSADRRYARQCAQQLRAVRTGGV
jgi:disulfide bond formation protein DsbB